MSPYAHIAGWGMYAPAKVLSNQDLERMVDTSDEWIRSRTGIVERRIAGEKESTSTMAVEAARRALARAHLSPRQLDAIIVATISPDYLTPATACLVQAALGADKAAAFDVSAGCSGFIYALNLARMGIAAGEWRNVLIIGAETLSRFVNWDDRSTCVLFGDGAGALVLVASEEPGGVLACVLGADGSGADLLSIPAGGSRMPAGPETISQRAHTIQMDGRAVYRFATRIIPEAVEQVMRKAGLPLSAVDMIIPHQANIRIIEAARKKLRLPEEAFYINLYRYGNTSAASIPIALCEVADHELINDGSVVVLVGFGAGLTWGAAAVRWGVPLPPPARPWYQRALYLGRAVLGRLPAFLRKLLYRLGRLLPSKREE